MEAFYLEAFLCVYGTKTHAGAATVKQLLSMQNNKTKTHAAATVKQLLQSIMKNYLWNIDTKLFVANTILLNYALYTSARKTYKYYMIWTYGINITIVEHEYVQIEETSDYSLEEFLSQLESKYLFEY